MRPRPACRRSSSRWCSPRFEHIREAGTTILLVEQNARAALAIGDRAYVLAEGRNAHEGKAAELWNDPVIGKLYLGLADRLPALEPLP